MNAEVRAEFYWRVVLSDGAVTVAFPCYARDRTEAITIARGKWKNPQAFVKEAVKMRNY